MVCRSAVQRYAQITIKNEIHRHARHCYTACTCRRQTVKVGSIYSCGGQHLARQSSHELTSMHANV
jgi:hypothetical protein